MAESQENKASEYDKKMSESQIYQVVRIKQASATIKWQSHKRIKQANDKKMSESQIYQVVRIKQASMTIKWQSHKRIKQASMTRKCQSHKYTKWCE